MAMDQGAFSARSSRPSLLRGRTGQHADAKVGYVELFFDLVFVFAVTQLSHGLLAHATPLGLMQTAMLLLGVWWVWIYTTWVTNWLDVERIPVRLLLFAMMAAGMFLAMAIADAFGASGLLFGATLAAMQLGRGLFMLAALYGRDHENFRNFIRITSWAAIGAPFWIAGGLSPDVATRMAWWGVALAIEYAGPIVAFWTPGMGRTPTTDWNVEGHHFAERCGLFVIIALGESILITGATFAEVVWSPATIGGFASAFIGAVAMWWIYFNIGAERGSELIAHHADPGRIARLAYTYLHLPIIAGIILCAAADEMVLAHPLGHADSMTRALCIGGPALYLIGTMAFKRTTARNFPLSHQIGLGLLLLLAIFGQHVAPLWLAIASSAVLVLVAAWETASIRGGNRTDPR